MTEQQVREEIAKAFQKLAAELRQEKPDPEPEPIEIGHLWQHCEERWLASIESKPVCVTDSRTHIKIVIVGEGPSFYRGIWPEDDFRKKFAPLPYRQKD
jgi:hypothetical protein